MRKELESIRLQKKIDLVVLVFFTVLSLILFYVCLKVWSLIPSAGLSGELKNLYLAHLCLGAGVVALSCMVAGLVSYQTYVTHQILEKVIHLIQQSEELHSSQRGR